MASALVVVTELVAAARVVPLFVGLPFLIASSVGRRFASTAKQVVVLPDGAIELGKERLNDVRDVWLEDDGEPRVVVAHGDGELAVLWFENREQARRFANAVERDDDARAFVAGYRPRKVDLLSPLRFAAIAIAFFAIGSWRGVFALLFVPLGLRGYFTAKQLIVRGEDFELRTAHDSETFQRASIVSIDIDEGIIKLKERELSFTTANARDVHLNAPSWADALRRRALKRLAVPTKTRRPATEATDLPDSTDAG